MRKKIHLLCHKIPDNTCRCSVLRGEYKSPCPSVHTKTFFQKVEYGKWKKNSFTVEKSDKTATARIKANTKNGKHGP